MVKQEWSPRRLGRRRRGCRHEHPVPGLRACAMPEHQRPWFWAVVWSCRLRLLVYPLPFVVGAVTSYVCGRRLTTGFRNEVWTDEELAPARAFLSATAWKRVNWLVLAFYMLGLLASLASSSHSHGPSSTWPLSYLVLFSLASTNNLRRLLCPPPGRAGGLVDWQNFKPILSAHWGEPAGSSTDPLHS